MAKRGRPRREPRNALGQRIDSRLEALHLTLTDLYKSMCVINERILRDKGQFREGFAHTETNPGTIKKYIDEWAKGARLPVPQIYLDSIAEALDLPASVIDAAHVAALQEAHAAPVRDKHVVPPRPVNADAVLGASSDEVLENPKPFGTGTYVLNSVWRVCGNFFEPLTLVPQYTQTPFSRPAEIVPIYDSLVERIVSTAARAGSPLWDGPCVRLVKFEVGGQSLDSGIEEKIITLHFAPVSWFEFMILNNDLLDEPVLSGRVTIRQRFGDTQALYRHTSDFSWCQLSNICCILMVPITTDGFGMCVVRDPRGVSNLPNAYTCGVSENIHPFLDEMSSDGSPAHPYMDKIFRWSTERGDRTYQPTGVPSPLLTAQRGLFEEVSEELAETLSQDKYKFLNINWSLGWFEPFITGVIETGLSRDELATYLIRSPGRDDSESSRPIFLRLRSDDPETAKLLSAPDQWDEMGLAALMGAINYTDTKRRRAR